MPPAVIVIPGGGGKTTLVSKHPDRLCDIDSLWDPTAPNELEMIRQYREACMRGDKISEIRVIDACMVHKACRARRSVALPSHVMMVQVPAQADIILAGSKNGFKWLKLINSNILRMVPTPALHEACMTARGDSERVKTICRYQRNATLVSDIGILMQYASFEELEAAVLQFITGKAHATEHL